MEEAENVGAGVDNGHVGVVSGQNPVGAVGGNWGKKTQYRSSRCTEYRGDVLLTVGEADAKLGRFSHVRNHRCPFGVSDLVFTERDSAAL